MPTKVEDVAGVAGVSIGTVSRVLSSELNVPEAITDRGINAV